MSVGSVRFGAFYGNTRFYVSDTRNKRQKEFLHAGRYQGVVHTIYAVQQGNELRISFMAPSKGMTTIKLPAKKDQFGPGHAGDIVRLYNPQNRTEKAEHVKLQGTGEAQLPSGVSKAEKEMLRDALAFRTYFRETYLASQVDSPPRRAKPAASGNPKAAARMLRQTCSLE